MSFWEQNNHPAVIKTPESIAEGIDLLEDALDEITGGLLKAEEMNKEKPPSPEDKTELLRFPYVRKATTFTEAPQNWSEISKCERGELGCKWEGHSISLFANSGNLSEMLGDCKPQTLYERFEGEIDGKGETYRSAWRPSFHMQVQRDISTAVQYLAHVCERAGWSTDPFDRLIAWDRESEQRRTDIRDAHVLIAKLRRRYGIPGGLFFGKGAMPQRRRKVGKPKLQIFRKRAYIKLIRQYEAARASGVSKKDFCNGDAEKLKELGNALAWQRMRNRPKESGANKSWSSTV